MLLGCSFTSYVRILFHGYNGPFPTNGTQHNIHLSRTRKWLGVAEGLSLKEVNGCLLLLPLRSLSVCIVDVLIVWPPLLLLPGKRCQGGRGQRQGSHFSSSSGSPRPQIRRTFYNKIRRTGLEDEMTISRLEATAARAIWASQC